MTRMRREALERKLEQARRLALEPTDPLTRERLAQMIEELEFQVHLMQCSTAPVFSTIQPIGCNRTSASRSQNHSCAIGPDKRRRCRCHPPEP